MFQPKLLALLGEWPYQNLNGLFTGHSADEVDGIIGFIYHLRETSVCRMLHESFA